MASELAVRVLELGDMTVVGLEGDLAADTAPLLDAELARALERESTTIVLDCSLLRSMGPSEVAVIVEAHDRVRQRHGRFVLRQPNATTRELLAEAGLLAVIEIES
jgi:anti-anti-sigma factor